MITSTQDNELTLTRISIDLCPAHRHDQVEWMPGLSFAQSWRCAVPHAALDSLPGEPSVFCADGPSHCQAIRVAHRAGADAGA